MILNTLNTIARRNVVRQLLIVTVIVLIGSASVVGAEESTNKPVTPDVSECIGFDRVALGENGNQEKVLATHCGSLPTMDSYWFYYTSEITLFQCMWGQITVSHGDTDLYIFYGEPWSSAVIPPSQAGQLICRSINGGTSTDACNGCSYACYYGVGGVWRAYAIPATVPTDYCLTVGVEGCELVDLAKAESLRRGTEIEVTWEVTAEQATAGYKLLRRLAPDEEWVSVSGGLVPVADGGHYRVLDTVPASAGDVFYRLEHVSLDGTSEHIANITDVLPMGGPFPPISE